MWFLVCFLFWSSFLVKTSLVQAKVVVFEVSKSQAEVYEAPSFDASVLRTLPRGTKIYGLSETQEGQDGMGLFHKVRLKKKVYGYMLDTSFKGFKPQGVFSKEQMLKRSKRLKKQAEQLPYRWTYPVSYTPALGGGVAYLNYTAKLKSGFKESSFEPLLTLRYTGGWPAKGWPLDLQVHYGWGPPQSVKEAHSKVLGNFGFMRLGVPMEFYTQSNYALYWGVGAELSYYSFEIGSLPKESSTELGFLGFAGVAFKLSSWALKLEALYLSGGGSHMGAALTLQKAL